MTQTEDTNKNDENDSSKETNKVHVGHPIYTSILNADNDLLRTYSHSKRVGNYLLGRTLGEGSFAKVKEGLHALTTTKVAVKVIDKKKATKDSYVRKNLRREGRILQTVRHANVAHLYEIMETENFYYLVLELCEGGDLMDRIYKLKRLEEAEVRKYMRQIISAVEYLHKAGVIHRDLKIENLLLSEHQDVKIIDFGLSNTVKVSPTSISLENRPKECLCQTQCGSPAYAAPELLANKKYGPEVDVWSIGVNMYAMLTGTLPFTVSPFNIQTLQNKMLKGEMNPLPDHLSSNCRDLVLKFLAPNPSKRITLQQAMNHPWIKNGKNGGILIPSKFPNKLRSSDLDTTILTHIADKHKFRSAEVSQIAVANTPHPYLATYMLLKKKLDKWRTKSEREEKNVQTPLPSSKLPTKPNKVQPFKRRQAQNGTDHSNDDAAHAKPQSPKRVAIVRPTEPRLRAEVKEKPVQIVLPARRCDSAMDVPTQNGDKDIVTDVMSPRQTDTIPIPTASRDEPASSTASTSSRLQLTKPFDMRQKTEPNLFKTDSKDNAKTESRAKIAPIRLLGQGPYVIRSNPRPELPSNEKTIDYNEWRQAVMKRNVVDTSKYDTFARTSTSKPIALPPNDPYDVGKYDRTRQNFFKGNSQLVTGYEINPMMRMLHKRSTQPNILSYETKETTGSYKNFVRQSTNLSDAGTSEEKGLALPSICPKNTKKTT